MEKTIKAPAVNQPAPRAHTCANCKYYEVTPQGNSCHINPPVGWIIPGAGGGPALMGFWPPCQPENWCSKWANVAAN